MRRWRRFPLGVVQELGFALLVVTTVASSSGRKKKKEPLVVVEAKKFCQGGIATRIGAYGICCPKSCGACEEKDECRSGFPGALACCPVSGVLAVGRQCGRGRDTSCFAVVANSASRASTDGHLQFHSAEEEENDDSSLEDNGEEVVVDVALAGDRSAYVGLLGSTASAARASQKKKKKKTRLRFHVFVGDAEDVVHVDAALRCAAPGSTVRVYHFDFRRYVKNAEVKLRAPVGASYGNLRSPANFARFYFAKMVPESVNRIVYLDADVVVRRDLGDLVAQSPEDVAVAAVPRASQGACFHRNASRPGMFFCEEEAFKAAGISEKNLETFNAGVAVFSLDVWRRKNIADLVETWLLRHQERPLWRLGSNPPLVLAAIGSFYALDPRWNCDGLGWKKPIDLEPTCLKDDAFIWHWSGPKKPWLPNGHFKHLWWNHLHDARCLTLLPPVLPPSFIQ